MRLIYFLKNEFYQYNYTTTYNNICQYCNNIAKISLFSLSFYIIDKDYNVWYNVFTVHLNIISPKSINHDKNTRYLRLTDFFIHVRVLLRRQANGNKYFPLARVDAI